MYSMVVFYPCRNTEETLSFYTSLGLTLAQRQPGCIILDSGYGYLGFTQQPLLEEAKRLCISFNCKSEEEVNIKYEEFVSAGLKLLSCPERHPQFEVYSFFIEDPNGYRVEFQKILKEGLL